MGLGKSKEGQREEREKGRAQEVGARRRKSGRQIVLFVPCNVQGPGISPEVFWVSPTT